MPNPLHSRIQQQYASERGRPFYRTVMGDGGFDIHYGHYADESVSMRQATNAATERLFELVENRKAAESIHHVIDLGSGRGGPAHFLARACSGMVTCVDLCAEHHDENQREAKRRGLSDHIETWLGTFEQLPETWQSQFDLVWGQESFCHAVDGQQLISEAFRVSKHGAILAFSDIMIADEASESDASAFSDVNAIMKLATPDTYRTWLESAGYVEVQTEDWTHHLETNFQRMFDQISEHRDAMIRQGVPEDYLDAFARSLESRIRWARGSVLRWGAFTAMRPPVS